MELLRVVSDGPERTGSIAAAFAGGLTAGDVVLLSGDLAAGKTLFVKQAVAALGSIDVVTSPTFALAQFYTAPQVKILHVDAYRIADVVEFRDLGLEEYFDDVITFVEWGDRVAGGFASYIEIDIHIDPGDTARRVMRFGVVPDGPSAAISRLGAVVLENEQ